MPHGAVPFGQQHPPNVDVLHVEPVSQQFEKHA